MKFLEILKKIGLWLVILVVPVVLLLTAVRLLLTPLFIKIEYGMPNFPDDRYGMTTEQRLKFAPIALEYLLNNEDISFLGEQTFEDGEPFYNERELKHMYDVKVVTQGALKVWIGGFVFLAIVGLWSWRGEWLPDFLKAVSHGGRVAVGLVVAMLIFLVLNFDRLFTLFHAVFFEGDSWLFNFSDSLIRMFPVRFWQDAFIFVGVFTLVCGLVFALVFRRTKK